MSIITLKRIARLLEVLITLDVVAIGASCNAWGSTASNLGQYAIGLFLVLLGVRYFVQRKISGKAEGES